MADISTNLPRAEANDAPEVVHALEAAQELWSKGLALESVRSIQRAAENAESAGNDLRALSLARAAADLRAEVNVASEPPGPRTEGAALAPYDDFTESTIVDSPAATLARVAQQNNIQIAELHPPLPSEPPLPAPPAVLQTPPPPTERASVAVQHQTVRVCVISADTTSRQLTLRVLEEGEIPPPGATQALLVSLDPHARLI